MKKEKKRDREGETQERSVEEAGKISYNPLLLLFFVLVHLHIILMNIFVNIQAGC